MKAGTSKKKKGACMKKLAPVAGLLAILCLVGSNAFAQTEVSGYQSGTWSFGDRPYIVTGSVTVPAGSTLTIEPGVVVKFCQYRGLSVHGTLIADGTSAHTILFTSNKDSVAPGDWSSIYFHEGSSSSILDHCIVEYGGGGTTIFTNVYIYNASPTITNCIIRNSSSRGIQIRGTSPPTITYSTITNNARYGVYCSDSSTPIINYNNIVGNSEYGVYNSDASVTIDATNNWWGDASGPYDPSEGPPDYNPDGKGDKVSDYITYRPWLLTGVEEDNTASTQKAIPKAFSLSQNYPNPFNSSTTLHYTIPQIIGERYKVKGSTNTSHLIPITLKVYNILGQLVRALVNEDQVPGYYSVVWDGRDGSGQDVSSGVYLCRLRVQGDRLKVEKIRRMVLIR